MNIYGLSLNNNNDNNNNHRNEKYINNHIYIYVQAYYKS